MLSVFLFIYLYFFKSKIIIFPMFLHTKNEEFIFNIKYFSTLINHVTRIIFYGLIADESQNCLNVFFKLNESYLSYFYYLISHFDLYFLFGYIKILLLIKKQLQIWLFYIKTFFYFEKRHI